eukprot:TRINITY_DN1119_c0_g1_i1.p1 TRINITY_DN1119_c0_g1~~TRINITY_DN1119_c0_g1_i1.p1  ORF type:complete len:149 (+),score=53.14 TRINITY_DN1119_c0_g1_i1:3-449(+)
MCIRDRYQRRVRGNFFCFLSTMFRPTSILASRLSGSFVNLSSPSRRFGHVTDAPGALNEREKAFENQYARKHTEEQLRKLKAKRETEGQEQPAQPAQTQSDRLKLDIDTSAPRRHITVEEFLEYRRDIMTKIRNLEDEVVTLRASLKK